MTTTDYRKEPNLDETIITPTSLPRVTRTQSLALLIACSGHSRTIGQLNGMEFYRMCKTFCAGSPMTWRMIKKTLVSEVCDNSTKWFVVLELLRLHAVVVRDGALVKKERKAA